MLRLLCNEWQGNERGEKCEEFYFVISDCLFFPFSVFAWNTPGQDFSGELKLGGPVTSTRNPWVWKMEKGSQT